MQRSTRVSKSSNTRHACQPILATSQCEQVAPELDTAFLNDSLIILRNRESDSILQEKAAVCLARNVASLVAILVSKRSEREDVQQQVVANVWQFIDSYDPSQHKLHDDSARGWLYRIVRNTHRGSYRGGRKPPVTIGVPDDTRDALIMGSRGVEEPVFSVIRREDKDRLARAMSYLTPEHRHALSRFYIEGADWPTIAQEMNISYEAMRKCAQRAKASLAEILRVLK